MNKILLPLDGSDLCEAAIDVAADMSGSETCFVLLRVLNPFVASLSKDEKKETREYLSQFVSRLAQKKAPADIRTLVVEGRPAETIIDVAEKENVGLIILTTSGEGGLARWLIGSVAERVVRHAPCPVLTIGRRTLEAGLAD